MLRYGKEDAETTLKKLNELSLYENVMELPLDMPVSINKLGNRLTSITQKHCHIGAITIFQTEFPDDFKLLTTPGALENLLMYLLNNASRFRGDGIIRLKCSDTEKCIRFSITGTRRKHDNQTDDDIYDSTAQDSFYSLNICQSISRLLHGRVWHDEEYSDGIRYIFEIQKSITDILMQNRLSYDADY
jgi:K+-sensing histidine kinase KdpD